MPSERNKDSGNPYQSSLVEGEPTERTVAESVRLVALVLVASGVAFFVGSSVGANVSVNVSSRTDEQAIAHGVVTGLIVGITFAVLLSRLLFHDRRGSPSS